MGGMSEPAVTIDLKAIYDLALETRDEVRGVSQTVRESMAPMLREHDDALKTKVEREEFDSHVKRVAALELRVWAAIVGALTAIGGLNVSGLI